MPSLLEGFLGQQDTPSFTPNYAGSMLKSALGKAPMIAKAAIGYNDLLVPGLTGSYLKGEALYDPNRADVRNAAGAGILGLAKNPYDVPDQLGDFWRQQGLQGAMGGAIPSQNAISNMFSAIGQKADQRAQNILGMAANYGNNTALRYAATQTSITTIDISPTLAVKVTDKASIGLGPDIQYAKGEFDQVGVFLTNEYFGDGSGIVDCKILQRFFYRC